MADTVGGGFPSSGIQKGTIHFDVDDNTLWQYLSGPPRLVSSWKLLNGVFSGNPDTSLWGSAQQGAIWFNQAEGRLKTWNGSAITDATPISDFYPYPSTYRNQEHFVNQTSAPYWIRNNGAQVAGTFTSGRPGITRISTTAVISTLTAYFHSGSGELITSAYDFMVKYSCKLNTIDANTQFRMGAMVGGGTINPPANGKYFEKLDADTTWFMITRAGGVETRVDTAIPIVDGFADYMIIYKGSENGLTEFYINNTLLLATTNNNGLTANIRPAFSLINSAAADKSFDLDYAEVLITRMT